MNIHCLDIFLKRFGTNLPEVFEILGLVLKARTKLRIVDKSMLMYDEHGEFISQPWPTDPSRFWKIDFFCREKDYTWKVGKTRTPIFGSFLLLNIDIYVDIVFY